MATVDTIREPEEIALEVAILGGGFTGVHCAQSLAKSAGPDLASRCGIISDQNYMVFQPMLAEVAGSSISPRHVVNPLRLLCRGIGAYCGTVTAIDLEKRQLEISAGDFSRNFRMSFKHLVLSLGAEIDLRRVPGMPEHALLMQNVGDAMILRARIISRIEEANIELDPVRRRSLLTFVVVGGGYSGVETAGELLDLLHSMVGFYARISAEDIRVILVHSREYILPTMDRDLSQYAMEKLRERGLELVLGRRVRAMTATRVYLDNGTHIETTTTVSTVGNAPHRIIAGLCRRYGLPNEKNRLRVGADMRVEGFDFLWAAGDCALVPRSGEEGYCPPTAQFAMRQGTLLGKNLHRAIQGLPTRPFRFRGLGELASIGHHTAVANVMGIRMSGFLAWFMWRTVYLSKLPGWERRLRVVMDWTLDLFFPRDITLLNPRYTTLHKEVHLEEGDVLFSKGEPAFSLYVLKKGVIHLRDSSGRTIRTIEAGEYFGERALLHGGSYLFTAVAAEPSQLISVSGQYFLPMVHESRKMSLLFARTSVQSDPHAEFRSLADKLAPGIIEDQVSRHMVRDVISVPAEATMKDALARLRRHRFSTWPIVDNDGQLVACFTEDDFFNSLKNPGINMESTVMKVDKVRFPVCRPDENVRTAMDQMIFTGRTKCFVTEDSGRLCGVIAILDLLPDEETSAEGTAG